MFMRSGSKATVEYSLGKLSDKIEENSLAIRSVFLEASTITLQVRSYENGGSGNAFVDGLVASIDIFEMDNESTLLAGNGDVSITVSPANHILALHLGDTLFIEKTDVAGAGRYRIFKDFEMFDDLDIGYLMDMWNDGPVFASFRYSVHVAVTFSLKMPYFKYGEGLLLDNLSRDVEIPMMYRTFTVVAVTDEGKEFRMTLDITDVAKKDTYYRIVDKTNAEAPKQLQVGRTTFVYQEFKTVITEENLPETKTVLELCYGTGCPLIVKRRTFVRDDNGIDHSYLSVAEEFNLARVYIAEPN